MFGSLEGWKLGGAPEVGPRPVASGDDEAERCAAPAKTLKDRKDRKDCQREEPQISQILSRLRACYRTQDCQSIFTTKRDPSTANLKVSNFLVPFL